MVENVASSDQLLLCCGGSVLRSLIRVERKT